MFICPGWFNLSYVYYSDPAFFKKKLLPADLDRELQRKSNTYSVRKSDFVDESVVNKADQILYIDFDSKIGLRGNGVLEKLRLLKHNSEEKFDFRELSVYRLR